MSYAEFMAICKIFAAEVQNTANAGLPNTQPTDKALATLTEEDQNEWLRIRKEMVIIGQRAFRLAEDLKAHDAQIALFWHKLLNHYEDATRYNSTSNSFDLRMATIDGKQQTVLTLRGNSK
jgi:hypothetical protein